VRWAAIFVVAGPILLLLIAGITAAAGKDQLTSGMLRAFRYLLAAGLIAVIVIAAIGATYEARSRNHDLRTYHPPGKLVDIGGYKLHLYCSGSGSPTVILDYGLEGSYLDWRRVQPEVARFTRVCSYDRAGYGWSQSSPKPRIPSAMMEELHSLLVAAGEKPPYVVVGHSYGGFDALMYAHQYRKEVAGVVLVDSSHPDELLKFRWKRRFWLLLNQLTMPLGLPRWRRWCGDDSTEIGMLKRAFSCQAHVPRTGYAQFAAFYQSAVETRNLGPLGSMPLVVVSRDPRHNPDSGLDGERWRKFQQELTQLSSNSTHVFAEGSGHDVPGQRPDVVVEAIRKLIAGSRP
jgi:pimeloyl-ACP methyl ester carboxylesterase